MTTNAYIISARRTLVAPVNGLFNTQQVHELSSPVISACLADAKLESHRVDELILSNALYGGGNPARVSALAAGLETSVAGLSIDRQCVGGLDAILLAARMVQSGCANIIVAGGAESYSRRPIRQHTFADGRAPLAYDSPAFTPWSDRDPDMHKAAADLARKLSISKLDQDEWAINSHKKALQNKHNLDEEVVQIDATPANCDPYTRTLTQRLCDRAKILSGDVTMATTAVAADAAAFCVIVSENALRELPDAQSVKITDGTTIGADPMLPGLAPVSAIKALGKDPNGYAHIELMEAYASQAIACITEANLDSTRTNQKGGALARGHPIGASGAILAVRLYHDLCRNNGSGLAAIAAAGGLGTAMVLDS